MPMLYVKTLLERKSKSNDGWRKPCFLETRGQTRLRVVDHDACERFASVLVLHFRYKDRQNSSIIGHIACYTNEVSHTVSHEWHGRTDVDVADQAIIVTDTCRIDEISAALARKTHPTYRLWSRCWRHW